MKDLIIDCDQDSGGERIVVESIHVRSMMREDSVFAPNPLSLPRALEGFSPQV